MDDTKYFREDQWERINDSLPGKADDVGRAGDNRRVIEAVRPIGRTGTPWRSLPRVYGLWSMFTNGSDGGRARGSGK